MQHPCEKRNNRIYEFAFVCWGKNNESLDLGYKYHYGVLGNLQASLTKQQFLSDTYGRVFLAGLPLSSSGGFDPFLGKNRIGRLKITTGLV